MASIRVTFRLRVPWWWTPALFAYCYARWVLTYVGFSGEVSFRWFANRLKCECCQDRVRA